MLNRLYFADFIRSEVGRARVVLSLFVLTFLFFVAVSLSPLKSGFADAPDRGPGDVELYRAEIDRIQNGQSYYAAANAELRERGYPTRSIFNWRTPLPMWLIGNLPSVDLGKAILGTAAVALLLLTFGLIAGDVHVRTGFLAVLLLCGAILPIALGDIFVMTEVWSGVFIALSAVAYGGNHRKLGIIAAILSLFLRELALPYCLVCIAFAIRDRQHRELVAWAVGFAAYGVFYALHLQQVFPLIQSTDIAHQDGWIRFGGAGFILATAQMNAWLLLLPQWVTAIFLSVALLGFAGWNSQAGQRIGITVALYLIAFSIVGQPINQYWGSMIAPLLCLGAALFPSVFVGLLRQSRLLPRGFLGTPLVSLPSGNG
jgi:hypothetical protein